MSASISPTTSVTDEAMESSISYTTWREKSTGNFSTGYNQTWENVRERREESKFIWYTLFYKQHFYKQR